MRLKRYFRNAIITSVLILPMLIASVDHISASTVPSLTTVLFSHFAGNSSPQLAIMPSSGNVGDLLTLFGNGFMADQNIIFRVDDNVLFVYQTGWDGRMQVMSDSFGAFGNPSIALGSALTPSVRFTIPNLVGGTHIISAQDEAGDVAKATLTVVEKIIVSPIQGLPGAQVRVYGTGMKFEIPVTITIDNLPIQGGTIVTDAGGLFDTIIEVPTIPKGIHKLNVSDGTVNTGFDFIVEGQPPSASKLLFPKTNSVTKNPVHFTWETVSDTSGVTYELQVSADPEFGKLLLDEKNLANPEYVMAEAEKINLPHTVLNWRVRAIDGIGNEGAWTSTFTFTIGQPWPVWVAYMGYGLGILVIIVAGLWIKHGIATRPDKHSKDP